MKQGREFSLSPLCLELLAVAVSLLPSCGEAQEKSCQDDECGQVRKVIVRGDLPVKQNDNNDRQDGRNQAGSPVVQARCHPDDHEDDGNRGHKSEDRAEEIHAEEIHDVSFPRCTSAPQSCNVRSSRRMCAL